MAGAKENKGKRIKPLKLICSAVTLILAVYTITLGWFTENKYSETDGVAGSSVSKGYRIITGSSDTYNTGVYDSMYTDENGSAIITDAKAVTDLDGNETKYVQFQDTDGNTLSGYASDGQVISWQMTEKSNAENYDESSIAPGTQGYVDFYIQPTHEGTLSVDFSLDIAAYCRVSEDLDIESAAEKIVENGADTDSAQNYYRLGENYDTEGVGQLVKGHIMLFTEDDDGQLNWLAYSIDSSPSFTVTADVTAADSVTVDGITSYKAIRKRIYWVWPQTWGQLTLDSSKLNVQDSGNITLAEVLKSLAESADDDVGIADDIAFVGLKTLFADGESDNAAYEMFFVKDSTGLENAEECMSGALEGAADVYTTMKKAWNSADQQIGKKVAYITLELTASKG